MWFQVKQELMESTTKFLTEVAHLLPGVVALILALLISFVLAWLLAIIVRRVLTGIHFDERLHVRRKSLSAEVGAARHQQDKGRTKVAHESPLQNERSRNSTGNRYSC